MANIRDITGKNRKFTGTTGIKLPEGTTAQRAGSPGDGELRFNTTTNLAEYYDGTAWKPIDSPPTITAVSPTSWASDGATRQTFTISGSNFQSGASAKFIGSDGTEYTGVNLSVTSSSTVTIQNTTAMNVSKEPYDIIITNPSGLAATIEDAVDAGGVPAFSTSADTAVATTFEGAAANTDFNETTIKATDPDGTAVTHTISAGALPAGLSLSTAGDITGTVSGSSVQTYTFTVSATDGTNVVTRQFNIPIITAPSIEYLVVAGGGGGGSTAGAARGCKPPCGAPPTARARQRLHVAYEHEGSLRVRLGAGGDAASDRFASADENMWNDTMWREIRVARPAE